MPNNLSSKKPMSHPTFWLLSVLVGFVAGLGAMVFRGLIGLFHNLLFLGKLSAVYSANIHTPVGVRGSWVVLVPVAGAFGVAFLVKNFALEAKGHGVPEVMDAIYYNKGLIRPVVAIIKSLASALSIGSGGSVGREGPIVQIGSSFGSTVGQWLQLPAWQRITMIAAGAGGGIAATFNTPIGGVLFAAELLLHEVSVWTLVPVVISTATATYIGRLLLGANPSFVIPAFETPYFHPTNPLVLLSYVGLGFLMGLVSMVFIKAIYWFEDFFDEKVPGNYYVRHICGMALVGVLICLMQAHWGYYYIEGVGYSTVQDVLSGTMASLSLLLLLFGLKVLATSLTLGSGGSGGIFSPSLFLGVTFGASYGLLLKIIFPGLPISPPAFAVVGMAGVVAGTTGAAITAIVMSFEMTLDYNVVLPMTITVAISYGIRKFLCKESIYTLKLARRGHYMPEALQANFHLIRLARDIMDTGLAIAPATISLTEFGQSILKPNHSSYALVEDHGKLFGVVYGNRAAEMLMLKRNGISLSQIAIKNYEVVTERTTVFELLSKLRSRRVGVFVVTAEEGVEEGAPSVGRIKGVISKEQITDTITQSFGLFSE